MHYKSFEKLYGKETTENHRPSLKNTKSKKKDKMKSTRAKHTTPFCPSAARAKNVGITVNCVECEKPRLLFSAKKLSEKDKTTLRRFLDTIFYKCGMSFHNTCDLAMAVSPKQPDDNAGNDDDTENYDEELTIKKLRMWKIMKKMNGTNLKTQIMRKNPIMRKKSLGKKCLRKRRILFVKYFQESLLMTCDPVHRKLRSHTTLLVSFQTFV